MFTWLNKQGVKSDEGYILQCMDRFFYHYIEDDHLMIIYVEGCFDNNNIFFEYIETSSFDEWQPPYDKEVISDQVKESIRRKVEAALTFMGIGYKYSEQ